MIKRIFDPYFILFKSPSRNEAQQGYDLTL